MIAEIVNFINHLEDKSPEIFKENLKLKDGIYIFLEKEGDELVVKENNILKVDGKTERNQLYEDFLELATNTEMLNAMKSFNSGPKIFIAIGSPFGIALNAKAYKKNAEIKLLNSADVYFKAAKKYMDSENQQHETWRKELEIFVKTKMLDYLASDESNAKAKDQYMFYFFMKEPSLKDYQEIQNRFLSEKLFNKDKFNVKTETGEIFGIADDLSGFNDKKEFLKHKTAPIELNYRVNGIQVQKLFQFFQLQQKNKVLPNPFPLFVDEQELSSEAIKFYKRDNKKYGHKEIIEELIKKKKSDLHNYYLIYFNNRAKGSKIIDLDFVPVFKHKFNKEIKIEIPFQTSKNSIHFGKIETVFDFERIIVQKIFNNQLVQKRKDDSYSLRYFDTIDNNPKYITANTYIQIMKYRKAFFDLIYKSKHQAITDTMFHDIMISSILDDISHDEYKAEKKYHTKEKDIKEKLNIWFSLYNFFPNYKNNENMIQKIEMHRKMVEEVAQGKRNVENDEEFAFVAGQVIYYIFSKSKSGDKSYSLLEPFLQKAKYDKFRDALLNAFNAYKHENFSRKFSNPFANVMDYEIKKTKNLKELLPIMLAGYFSDCLLFSDKKDDTE